MAKKIAYRISAFVLAFVLALAVPAAALAYSPTSPYSPYTPYTPYSPYSPYDPYRTYSTSQSSSASSSAGSATNGAAEALAAQDSGYVMDGAGLLTAAEAEEIESLAENIAEEYGCGVYVVTVDDYRLYGSTPKEAAKAIFADLELGYGEERNTILLLLSMEERDYWLLGYGKSANRAMTDYAREQYIAPRFLDNFKRNDWKGGFSDFMGAVEHTLSMAKNGTPLEKSTDTSPKILEPADFAIAGGIGIIVAAIICLILKSMSKTVAKGTLAHEYIVPESHELTVQEDYFTHTTVQRIRRERQSSGGGGGTSIDSGGFSGSGGKF